MFQARRGFCEHYAQSFVVMMRAAGLPARVVTGYHGGEYHQAGGFWQLRSKDAHAWAEVWLAGEAAWLRVDPTAAAASVRPGADLEEALPESERALLAGHSGAWARWSETGQYYWQQWVVNYDQSKQNSLFAALGLGGFELENAAVGAARGAAAGAVAASALVGGRAAARCVERRLYAVESGLVGR